jgi:streptogramin lyase
MMPIIRSVVASAALSLFVASCQSPAPLNVAAGAVPAPSLTLDAGSIVEALANKPSLNWQDAAMTYPPLLERKRNRGYRVQAPAPGAIAGSFSLPSVASSAPAFAKADVWRTGPAPHANDYLFVVTDGGTLYKLNPTTMATIASRSGLRAYARSAVLVSGDNKRIYLFSTNGFFTVLNASDLSTIYDQRISLNGFTGTAAFIDYSVAQPPNTEFGSVETMYVVSTDGSLYKIRYGGGVLVDAYPASNGTDKNNPMPTWASNTPIPYGAAVSVTSFPVAWRGKVFFGTSTGMCYGVNLNGAPTVQAWNLGANSSATGTAKSITAPPALDFDNNFDINAVFVSCGDRLNWINPITGTVVASPSLTLDRDPGPDSGALSGYTAATSTLKRYALNDWISIQANGTPTPTRWGDTALNSISATGLVATSVRVAPNGDIWVTDQAGSKVTRYTNDGTLIGSITLANGANRGPIKLEFDPSGNCWVVAGQIPNGGFVEKLTPGFVRAFPTKTNVTNALYLDTTTNGDCWFTDFNGQRVFRTDSNGNVRAGFPVNVAQATTIYNDPNTNNAWVTSFGYGGTTVKRVTPAGAVTSFTTAASPIGVDFDPLTGNVWVTNNAANSISILNPTTGAKVQPDINLNVAPYNIQRPWAIRFEPNGTPWITCMDYFNANPRRVFRLNRSGVAQVEYAMPGKPWEIDFDSQGTAWVATDAGLVRILDIGNTADIFGAAFRFTAAGGNGSYGYMRFRIPAGDFLNQVPTKAELMLRASSTSTDSIELYTANPDRTATAAWLGYATTSTPSVDWNNRPSLLTGLPFATRTGFAFTKDAPYYNFAVPMPGDQVNSSTAQAQYAYAVRSIGEQLRDAVHWYSPKSSGGDTTKHPELQVTLDTAAAFDTTKPGISAQATLDANAKKVYVTAGNALFQLSYANASDFASTASTYYNLTQAGRTAGVGPTTAAPKRYLFTVGNVLLTPNYRVITADFNANGTMFFNNFNTNLAPTADRLAYTVDANPGRGQIAQQMLYDYEGGHAYAVTLHTPTNTYRVLRANILQ